MYFTTLWSFYIFVKKLHYYYYYYYFGGEPEGKRPLGRPKHRWEDNMKIYLQEVGCGGMYWIELTQDRDR